MRKTALVVSIILTAIILTKGAYASTFSPATKVNHDESPAFQRNPKVSFDQNGKPICVWKDERSSVNNIYSSIKDGTWQEELLVNDSATDYREQPDISGNIGVWNDYRSGSWLYSSIFNGTKWSANVQVNSPPSTGGYEPFLAKSASGKTSVTWAGGVYSWDIFYSEWTGNGWAPTETVTATVQTEWHPTLAFFGDRPIVVWLQPTAPGTILLYSTKEGGSWAPPRYIPTGDIMISSPGRPYLVANSSNTKLVVLWFDYRYSTNNIYLAEYDEASNSFIDDRVITDPDNKANGKPAGAFDSDGNLWVVWEEYKSGQEQIYYAKRDPAGNWSENEPLSPSEYAQQNPDIDSQGKRVVVVWEQDSIDYLTGRDIYSSELSSSPPPKEPILIVPGMNASTSWELVTNLKSSWRLWPVAGTGIYSGLQQTLSWAGFDSSIDLFTVAYDWRKPHQEIASRFLKPAIELAKQHSPTGKVDIVAHSQGGIVARTYIQGESYENDVDTLITIGSPHEGTPKTYYMWEGAVLPPNYLGLMRGFHGFLLNLYYAQELGRLSKFEVNQKYFPSSKEILPVYDFLRREDGTLKDFRTLSTVNTFLLNLNETGNLLSRVHFKNLAGTGFDTTSILNVREHTWEDGEYWIDGFPVGEETANGDATVTQSGAVSEFAEEVQTLNLDHSDLIIKEGGVRKICEMLGVEAEEYFSGKDVQDYVHFIMRSPATLLVTSSSGKSIGFDPSTQTYINELENAGLIGEEDDFKLVTIGNAEDGQYEIRIIGTGTGNYHLTTIIENATDYSIKEIQGETQEGQQDALGILVDTENPLNSEIIDPSGEINKESSITKIEELTEIAKSENYDFIVKNLNKISDFIDKNKPFLALNKLYDLRVEITRKIDNRNKRIFYKDQLDSIAVDLTETYANTSIVKKKIAKLEIFLAEESLKRIEAKIARTGNLEAREILNLGKEKLEEAKVQFEKETYSKAFILATQAGWLGKESLLTSFSF